jgi:ATP-dependent DNA ligase
LHAAYAGKGAVPPPWLGLREKYDGWRMLAFKDGEHVRLVSRNGIDHTERLHNIAAAIYRLPADRLVLDGDVCARPFEIPT